MLSIYSNIDVSNFWSYLGTFYDFLSNSDKENIEIFWKALSDGLEALRFNLSESFLSTSLVDSKGYIEDRLTELNLNLNDLEAHKINNIEIKSISQDLSEETILNYMEYYVIGVQTRNNIEYTTSCINKKIVSIKNNISVDPVIVEWDKLNRIDYYIVFSKNVNETYYKKTIVTEENSIEDTNIIQFFDYGEYTSIVNSLPIVNNTIDYLTYTFNDDYLHLYIPELIIQNDNLTLTNLIDYELINGKYLNIFFNNLTYNKYNFLVPLDLKLNKIYTNLWSKIFKHKKFDLNKLIFIQSYSTYILTENEEDLIKQNITHLVKLTNAIIVRIRAGLSIKRLGEILSLYHNIPFSYDAGIVLSGSASNEIVISDKTYTIPSGLTLTAPVGSTVNKFDILCSGCSVHDYISNPEEINVLTSGNSSYYYTVGIKIPNELKELNYYNDYVDDDMIEEGSILLKNIMLPGIIYKYME